MKTQNLPFEFFTRNRSRLKGLLPNESLALVFSNPYAFRSADQRYIYRQNSDLFYLTGINQAETVYAYDSVSKREVLFISKPDPKWELWNGKLLCIDEVKAISGIDDVRYVAEFQSFVDVCVGRAKQVGASYSASNSFAKGVVDYLFKTNPSAEPFALTDAMARLRVVKSAEEISFIKQSIEIASEAFHALLKAVKPGNFEYQVEAEMIRIFISRGADGHAFDPIVASGKNACTLHYIDNNSKMMSGDMLLLDFGCEFNGYTSDMSRTLPVGGKFSARQKEVYQAVLDAQKEVIRNIRPGILIKELNEITGRFLEQRMIDLGLFTVEDIAKQQPDAPLYKKYFPHGVSHFMGIDVHDVGSTDKPLEVGAVLTCEPGIYIPEERIGVRIENDILITPQGCEDLMEYVPREISEIEALMAASRL